MDRISPSDGRVSHDETGFLDPAETNGRFHRCDICIGFFGKISLYITENRQEFLCVKCFSITVREPYYDARLSMQEQQCISYWIERGFSSVAAGYKARTMIAAQARQEKRQGLVAELVDAGGNRGNNNL